MCKKCVYMYPYVSTYIYKYIFDMYTCMYTCMCICMCMCKMYACMLENLDTHIMRSRIVILWCPDDQGGPVAMV